MTNIDDHMVDVYLFVYDFMSKHPNIASADADNPKEKARISSVREKAETTFGALYDRFVGRWDYRTWQGHVPELTYDWHNALSGLYPGYVKHAPIAWYCDHKVMPDGSFEPYAFCYLTRYDFDVPDSAATVTLPENLKIFIAAATVAKDPDADIAPAQPLYDELNHTASPAPMIGMDNAPEGSPVKRTVHLQGPLYGAADAPIRYTLDGSEPSSYSLLYSDSDGAGFGLAQTAMVRATVIRSDGSAGPVAATRIVVTHPLPPAVSAVIRGADMRSVRVRFSEPMSKAQAEMADRREVSPDAAVTSAVLDDAGADATLQLERLIAGASYALSVHGISADMTDGLSLWSHALAPDRLAVLLQSEPK